MDKEGQMLTISDIAEILNVSEKTIRRHIQSGQLKSNKIGGVHRISKADLDMFLNTPPSGESPESFPRANKTPAGQIEKKWESHKQNSNRTLDK